MTITFFLHFTHNDTTGIHVGFLNILSTFLPFFHLLNSATWIKDTLFFSETDRETRWERLWDVFKVTVNKWQKQVYNQSPLTLWSQEAIHWKKTWLKRAEFLVMIFRFLDNQGRNILPLLGKITDGYRFLATLTIEQPSLLFLTWWIWDALIHLLEQENVMRLIFCASEARS